MRLLLVALAFILGTPFVAEALMVEPSAIDLSVTSDQVAATTFFITNNTQGEAQVELSIVVASLEQDEVWKFSSFDETWLSLDTNQAILTPGEAREVIITASPSASISQGVHTFGVLAHELSTEKQPGLSLSSGFVTFVFVTVGDSGVMQSECQSFSITRDSHFLTTQTVLANNGSGILQAQGMVVARGIFGRDHILSSWNQGNRRVLPGQTRTFTEIVQLPWMVFGPVSISLVSDDVSCSSVSVIVWPSASILAIAGALTVIGAGGVLTLRSQRS